MKRHRQNVQTTGKHANWQNISFGREQQCKHRNLKAVSQSKLNTQTDIHKANLLYSTCSENTDMYIPKTTCYRTNTGIHTRNLRRTQKVCVFLKKYKEQANKRYITQTKCWQCAEVRWDNIAITTTNTWVRVFGRCISCLGCLVHRQIEPLLIWCWEPSQNNRERESVGGRGEYSMTLLLKQAVLTRELGTLV
jgi:transposase-like protein